MSKNAVNNFYNISLFCQVTLSRGKGPGRLSLPGHPEDYRSLSEFQGEKLCKMLQAPSPLGEG
jgi:hypothetical protein